MKIANIFKILSVVFLLGLGSITFCAACEDGCCHWDEIKAPTKEVVASNVEAPADAAVEKAEEPVAVADNSKDPQDSDEEEEFDPEAFAKFAQRLKDGDKDELVDTAVRVVDEKTV
ncbi:hypothetical protein KKA53_04310 [Candidatus Dependentiae bacterium]|nr:hypothetical protein [Candidatus Dependentiae bacterium]